MTPMTPMTPLIDTPNGRLAELITLLVDVPLHVGFEAVERSDTFSPSQDRDPWWIVASALVRLRGRQPMMRRTSCSTTRTSAATAGRDCVPNIVSADAATDGCAFRNESELLGDVLSGLIDLAVVSR